MKKLTLTAVGALCLGVIIGITSNFGLKKQTTIVYEVKLKDVKTDAARQMLVRNPNYSSHITKVDEGHGFEQVAEQFKKPMQP